MRITLRKKAYRAQKLIQYSLKIREVRISCIQNKVEKIVKADNAQSLTEIHLKRGFF